MALYLSKFIPNLFKNNFCYFIILKAIVKDFIIDLNIFYMTRLYINYL